MNKVNALFFKFIKGFCATLLSGVAVYYILGDEFSIKILLIALVSGVLSITFKTQAREDDGAILVDESADDTLRFTIECYEDPEDWLGKDHIVLAIKHKEKEEE